MNCLSCGEGMEPGQNFCDTCGAAAPQGQALVPTGQPVVVAGVPAPGALAQLATTAAPALPEPAANLPGSPICRGIDETIWRTYRVLKVGGPAKGEGYLYVTDARVVFFVYSTGFLLRRPSALVQQTKVEDINGLRVYVSRRYTLALLLIALLSVIFAISCLRIPPLKPIALLFFLSAIIALAFMISGSARIGTTAVRIQSRHGVSPVDFGGAVGFNSSVGAILGLVFHPWRIVMRGLTARLVADFGLPGQDADQVVAELGALILDLQTRGRHAAGHWNVQVPAQAREPSEMPS